MEVISKEEAITNKLEVAQTITLTKRKRVGVLDTLKTKKVPAEAMVDSSNQGEIG